MTSQLDQRPVEVGTLLEGAALFIGSTDNTDARKWYQAYEDYLDQIHGPETTISITYFVPAQEVVYACSTRFRDEMLAAGMVQGLVDIEFTKEGVIFTQEVDQ
jgi:hypothetical protein